MFVRTQSRVLLSESANGVRYDDTALNAIKAAHRRKWTTIFTLVALVALGVGVYVYSHVSKSREDALITAYLQADKMFTTEQESYIAEMQKPGADPAMIGKPNHLPSAKKFEEFARKYPAHNLGWLAAFRAASEYIEKKQTHNAIALLEMISSRTMKHQLIQVRARRTLAGLYADKADYTKALAELDILEKIPDNPVLAENRLFKAKVFFLAGRKDDAAKILKELAANSDLSTMGDRSTTATEAALWLGHWGL